MPGDSWRPGETAVAVDVATPYQAVPPALIIRWGPSLTCRTALAPARLTHSRVTSFGQLIGHSNGY